MYRKTVMCHWRAVTLSGSNEIGASVTGGVAALNHRLIAGNPFRVFLDGIVAIKPGLSPHPEGIKAISRGLSEATPTVNSTPRCRIPKGCQQSARTCCDPFGIDNAFSNGFRWCSLRSNHRLMAGNPFRVFLDGFAPLKPGLNPHPEGIKAISRGLSEATPTVVSTPRHRIPKGCQQHVINAELKEAEDEIRRLLDAVTE